MSTTNLQAQESAPRGEDIPRDLRPYFLALLYAGPNRKQLESEMEELQQQHLAFIHQQVEAKKFLLAGPVTDTGLLRGIVIISASSAEDAASVLEQDPAVRAGRLRFEVHPAMLPSLDDVVKY